MTDYPGLPKDSEAFIDKPIDKGPPLPVPTDNSPERINELDLAKRRAIDLIEDGELAAGWVWFVVTLSQSKWSDRYHAPLLLGNFLRRANKLSTPELIKEFIEDFT
ncbi:hypothetical protein [Coleofasciculus sp. F4-SAH-05]|uniref:hypothetical protein n=1 Tax=Coleofasciculus sp. F4-SAH-05 TaxID=3069525 RepID=UPI0032F42349